MDKLDVIKSTGTSGINYGVTNADVIARLRNWDEKYELTLAGIEADIIVLHLGMLPDDLDAFVHEVYEFSPDTVDKYFGYYADLISITGELGETVPYGIKPLVEGVDLSCPDHGLEIFKRSILRDKIVCLWWD